MKNLPLLFILFFSTLSYSQVYDNCYGADLGEEIGQNAECPAPEGPVTGFSYNEYDLPVRYYFENVDPMHPDFVDEPNNANFHCDENNPVTWYEAREIVEKIISEANTIFDDLEIDQIDGDINNPVGDAKISFSIDTDKPCWTSVAPVTNPSIIIIEDGESNPIPYDKAFINVIVKKNPESDNLGGEYTGTIKQYNMHAYEWNTTYFAKNFLHEFGHQLGLRHAFSCQNNIYDIDQYRQCAPPNYDVNDASNDDCDFDFNGVPCASKTYPTPGYPENCTNSPGGARDCCYCPKTGNNVMGYKWDGGLALTHGQLQLMHINLVKRGIKKSGAACILGTARIIESGTVETWDSYQQILGDIIVEANAELNIKCAIDMLPTSKVLVESGGVLRIKNGGGIRGIACNTDEKSWSGIIVRGGRNPSKVFMEPLAFIRDAKVGISSKDGGQIVANLGFFENCETAISIRNSTLIDLKSCQIHRNGFVVSKEKMEYGIKLVDCLNVNIENCIIHGMNKSAIDLTNTSATVHNCTILDAGIGAKVGSTDSRKHLVSITGNKSNEFKKCGVGVYVAGMDEVGISRCDFKENGAGIIVLGESLYTIEENIFACHHNDINLISSGSKQGSVINCNNHQGSTVNCIQVMGINDGVQIDNEKFRGEKGISLNPNNFGHSSWGSASLFRQGTFSDPRMNRFFFSSATNTNKIFSNSPPFSFFPSGTTSNFGYFFQEGLIQYPSDPDLDIPTELVPECDVAGKNNYPLICNKNNNYSLEVGNDPFFDPNNLDNCEPPVPIPLPCNDSSCFTSKSNKLTQIKSLLNGGNSKLFELAMDGLSTENSNLISQVMEASPYVTWDVLGAVLQNSSITDGDKLLVLQANGPYTENFIEYSGQFLEPEAIANLEIGSFYGSQLDSIIFELKKTTLIRNGIKNHLIGSISSEEDFLELEQLLINSGHEEDLIDLYTLYSKNNLTQEALDLNNLMSSSENEVVSDFAYSQNIFHRFLNEEGYIPLSEEISLIKGIADKHSTISGYAASIYSSITEKNIQIEIPEGEQPPVCSIPQSEGDDLGRSIQNAVQNSKVNKELRGNYFNLSPNPAFTEVNIFFKEKISGELMLTDLYGRVYDKTFIKDQVKFLINVIDYPNGVYLLIFKSDTGFIESKKLILNK